MRREPYLYEGGHKFERKAVSQNRLDEDAEGHDMGPDHDALAPAGVGHAQSLAPDLLLLAAHALQLALLLLLAALDVLVLARRPSLLAALLLELGRVLLECGHRIQDELVVVREFDGRPWNHSLR